MSDVRVGDDEVVYRRVPISSPWLEDGEPTSANFKLDRTINEQGVSVYRADAVTASDVLDAAGGVECMLTSARVGDIRALVNGVGSSLELDVIRVDDECDPGHCEIRGPIAGSLSKSASKALRDLFRPVASNS